MMKITDKRSVPTTMFGSIRLGEPFRTKSGRFYLRIYPATYMYKIVTAADLETGELVCFLDDDEVIPITAELVYEDRKVNK